MQTLAPLVVLESCYCCFERSLSGLPDIERPRPRPRQLERHNAGRGQYSLLQARNTVLAKCQRVLDFTCFRGIRSFFSGLSIDS